MSNYDPNPQASEVPEEKRALTCINGCCVLVPRQSKKKKEKAAPKHISLDFTCNAKGLAIQCGGIKTKAHIVTQQIRNLKTNQMNILTLCENHAAYFNNRPLKEWYRWVKRHFPQNFKYVHDKMKFIYDQVAEYMQVAEEDYQVKEQQFTIKEKLKVGCSCECHTRWKDYPLTTHCISCMKNHPFKPIV